MEVYVGLNDWGMVIINSRTLKLHVALQLKVIETNYETGRGFIEVSAKDRSYNYVFRLTTKQVRTIFMRIIEISVVSAKNMNS